MKRFSGRNRGSSDDSGDRERLEREAEAELNRVVSASNRAAGRPSEPSWSPPPPPSRPPARYRPPEDEDEVEEEDLGPEAEDEWAEEDDDDDEEPLTPEEESLAITEMALHQLAERYGADPEEYVFEPIDPAAATSARDAGLARFFQQQAGVRQRSERPSGPGQRPMLPFRPEALPSEARWVVGGRSGTPEEGDVPPATRRPSPPPGRGKPTAGKRTVGSGGMAKAAAAKKGATKAAGTKAAGTKKAGAKAPGAKAAATKALGTKKAGVKTAGTKAAGTKKAGTKAAGTTKAGAKAAGTKKAGGKAVGRRTRPSPPAG
jgi:hypothetical protein